MRRRMFLAGAVSAMLAGASRAQRAERVRRVAMVAFGGITRPGPHYAAIRDRLAERGYIQGRNLDFRVFSRPSVAAEEIDGVAKELVEEALRFSPEVIFAGTAQFTLYVMRATNSVPIVFGNVQDPQSRGLVKNLARPEANVTGVGQHYDGLTVKRLELIREILPSARNVLVVFDRRGGEMTQEHRRSMENAAARLKLNLIRLDTTTIPDGLCAVDVAASKAHADALVTWGSIFAAPGYDQRKPWGAQRYGECLAEVQRRLRIPVLDDSPDTVSSGVALALGEDQTESYRRAADIIARILGGAKPADIPVDLDMRMQLLVNESSLRELGLSLPPSVRLRIDRVVAQ